MNHTFQKISQTFLADQPLDLNKGSYRYCLYLESSSLQKFRVLSMVPHHHQSPQRVFQRFLIWKSLKSSIFIWESVYEYCLSVLCLYCEREVSTGFRVQCPDLNLYPRSYLFSAAVACNLTSRATFLPLTWTPSHGPLPSQSSVNLA